MKALTELEAAIAETADATQRYLAASAKAGEARREETECLNRMNRAQKALDEVVHSIKKSAPAGSDWGRKTTPVAFDVSTVR